MLPLWNRILALKVENEREKEKEEKREKGGVISGRDHDLTILGRHTLRIGVVYKLLCLLPVLAMFTFGPLDGNIPRYLIMVAS